MAKTIDTKHAKPTAAKLPTEPLSAEDYRSFFETLGEDVISSATDSNGNIIYVNEKFVEISKYSREELLGQNHRVLKSGAHNPEFYSNLWKTVSSGKVWRGEIKNRAKDGTFYWVDTSIAPILGKDGKPEKYVSVRFLITERKQVEEELERRKEHADFLASATALLISSLDYEEVLRHIAELLVPRIADWCVIDLTSADQGDRSLNRVASSHRDHSQLRLLRRLQTEFPPDPDRLLGAYQVFKTGRSEFYPDVTEDYFSRSAHNGEHQEIMKNIGIASIVRVPVRSRDAVLGVITLARTSSARRFTRDDLTLAEELGRRSGSAIENARLYQRLQDADKRKDEFIATLAHELRNPLAPLLLNSELLKKDIEEISISDERFARIAESAASTGRQAETMARLLDDLLDIARLMSGKVVLKKEVTELQALIERAAQTTHPLFESFGVALSIAPSTALTVYADPLRIEQVFVNLLNNAAKYNRRGGHVDVSFRTNGERVQVMVKDDGIGIEEAALQRIFDIFTQAGPKNTHSFGGLGIGLALAKNFVTLHGGTLTASSGGSGQGSEFTVELPLAKEDRLNPRSATILVVDDNADAAHALSEYLKRMDYTGVHVAHNGEEAVAMGKTLRPNFVLMDIRMPGMDGYATVREMRQHDAFRDTMFVAITGYGQEEDRRRTQAAGFSHHFTKPVDLSGLLNVFIQTT